MIHSKYIIPKSTGPKVDEEDALAKPALIMLVGGTGVGKSTCLANLLMALDAQYDWNRALFVSGNMRDDILKSIEMDKTSTPMDLEDFISQLQQSDQSEPEYNLLVLDDLQGSPDFNIMLGRSTFAKFILSHRHFGKVEGLGGTWVLAAAQTLKNSFSPTFRKNVTLWFLWYPRDMEEMKEVEKISGDVVKMRKALRLLKMEDKHAFLFINKIDPTNVRYFIGFDRELDLT